MKLLIATRNSGKLAEFERLLKLPQYELVNLDDAGVPKSFDVEETGATTTANARLKAECYGRRAKMLALADDSGLMVEALQGAPGVFSKRYGNTDKERIAKLLEEMEDVPDNQRQARFVCSVCLYNPENTQFISEEGVVDGKIAYEPAGKFGFGYDPIFIPTEGGGHTFAQLGEEFKNAVSHRARALDQIKKHLIKLAESD